MRCDGGRGFYGGGGFFTILIFLHGLANAAIIWGLRLPSFGVEGWVMTR